MKKILAGIIVFTLFAVLVTAGCIDTAPSNGGFSDPILGTWKMTVQSDFIRYYEYTFNNDLTGKEAILDCKTNEVLMEETFKWIRHNDEYVTEPDSETNKGETFVLTAGGKMLLDSHGYSYHRS